MSTDDDFASWLANQWCQSVRVERMTDGAYSVSTPFTYPDGDAYPLVVERLRGGWRLSDRGFAIGHLGYDELELTATRLRQLDRFASENGYAFHEDRGVEITLDARPTPEDLADFIELVARISGIGMHVTAEREAERFGTRVRARVRDWLAPRPATAARDNWWPQTEIHGASFRADLWIPTDDRPVVAFFAGSVPTAEKSMNTAGQYRRWELPVKPLLIHNGVLKSDHIYRAQTVLDDETAVIRVREQASETGFMELRNRLAAAGVALQPA